MGIPLWGVVHHHRTGAVAVHVVMGHGLHWHGLFGLVLGVAHGGVELEDIVDPFGTYVINFLSEVLVEG